MEKIVLDTNILIEVLKGNDAIVNKLETSECRYCVSSITAMELYYGALNKAELYKLKKFINLFELFDVNQNISFIATELIFEYSKSHNLTIPDSLIAATAIHHNMQLHTLNVKDFVYIEELSLYM